MSRARRNATALLALAAASLALAACGGDDEQASTTPATVESGGSTRDVPAPEQASAGEGAGPSDEQQVEAAIGALLTDRDNDFVCNEVLTQNLLETAYGDLRGCTRARAPGTLARSVEVKGLAGVDGDRVSVVVVPKGGLYDGEKLDVVAVRDGGSWRIDELTADIPVGP